MKKLVVVGVTVVFSLCFLACSVPVFEVLVEVSCYDFVSNNSISQETELPVGGLLKVTLCSNPTTGYRWQESAEISDPDVLRRTGHEFVGPENEPPPPPGTPGQEVWTFEALKAGVSTVSVDYSQPWEGGEKRTWTYTLVVTVK